MDLMKIKILSVSIFCIFLTACMDSPTDKTGEASDPSSTAATTQENPAKSDTGEEGTTSKEDNATEEEATSKEGDATEEGATSKEGDATENGATSKEDGVSTDGAEQTESNDETAESNPALTKDETTEGEGKESDAAKTEEASNGEKGAEKQDAAAVESPEGGENTGGLQMIDVEDPAVIAAATFAAEKIGHGELDTVLDAKVQPTATLNYFMRIKLKNGEMHDALVSRDEAGEFTMVETKPVEE